VGDSFRVSRAGATVLESSEVGQRSPESRSVPLSTASLSRRSSRPSRCFIRSAVGRSVDCGSNAACASYFVGASEHQIKARSRCTCLRQSSAIDLSDRRLPPVPPPGPGGVPRCLIRTGCGGCRSERRGHRGPHRPLCWSGRSFRPGCCPGGGLSTASARCCCAAIPAVAAWSCKRTARCGHAHSNRLTPVLDVLQESQPALSLYESLGWRRAGPLTLSVAGLNPLQLWVYLGPDWRRGPQRSEDTRRPAGACAGP
jgi:hypothetical protein